MAKRLTTIKRTLHYFNITATGGDKGLFGGKLTKLFDEVASKDREYFYRGTWVNFELIERDNDDGKIRGVIKQLRTAAPSKRTLGNTATTPIDLEEDEGIDESTHFIYDTSKSLLSIEYNYHGPKVGLLVHMVNSMFKDAIDKKAKRSGYMYVQTERAVDKVVERQFVRSVIAKPVDPMTVGGLSDDLNLPDVFKAFEPPKESRIEVKLTAQERGGMALKMTEFKRLFLRNKEDLQYYDKLNVAIQDESGKTVEYDLIKDKLQDDIVVELLPGTNQLDTSDIMTKMNTKMNTVKKERIIN